MNRQPIERNPDGTVVGDRIDGYCGFCGDEGHKALNCTALTGGTLGVAEANRRNGDTMQDTDMIPTLGKIARENGAAGQVAYTVAVTYPGEQPSSVTFVGSIYGGPVVMVTPGNTKGVFVTEPSRFGKFSPQWVRRFFGVES